MDLCSQFALYRTIYMGCPLQRAKLLQTCSKTFILIDRDRREDSLVINQSGSDTYSTVRFHQLGKHPCMHLRWMPNGYIGLYLIVSGARYICVWQHDSQRQHRYSYIFKGREVLRWQDRSENQLSRKRNKCGPRKENQNKVLHFFTGIISLIIDIIDFKKLHSEGGGWGWGEKKWVTELFATQLKKVVDF